MTVLRGNLTAREPSVPRGRLGTRSRQRLRADGLFLVGAELTQLCAEVRIGDREDGDGEQGGVHGAGLSDAERSDGDAGRHLNRRKERVEAFQGNAFHRDAEHGQDRVRGKDPREMRGAASGGDDHGETALLGARGPLGRQPRAPVSRHDAALVRDAEARQQLVGVFHRLPVGRRTHDDAHERPDASHGAGSYLSRLFRRRHMWRMIASPKPLHFTSVAPSIWRAKSYVTVLAAIAPSMPLRTRSAASFQPMYRSIISPDRMTEPGLTLSRFVYFGAVPCVASKMAWPVT